MKVCTDACLLGAWAANKFAESNLKVNHILDIGAGTGLLSLMLAQYSDSFIDAVEIHAGAADQAKENILRSPWKDRISVYHKPIQEFIANNKYGLIISNPPFFENDLRSGDDRKNISRHASALKLNELVFHIKVNLKYDGKALVLLPFHRIKYFEEASGKNGLYVSERLLVKHSTRHDFFRCIISLAAEKPGSVKTTEISIHGDDRNYTEEFVRLLQPFYLNL